MQIGMLKLYLKFKDERDVFKRNTLKQSSKPFYLGASSAPLPFLGAKKVKQNQKPSYRSIYRLREKFKLHFFAKKKGGGGHIAIQYIVGMS